MVPFPLDKRVWSQKTHGPAWLGILQSSTRVRTFGIRRNCPVRRDLCTRGLTEKSKLIQTWHAILAVFKSSQKMCHQVQYRTKTPV